MKRTIYFHEFAKKSVWSNTLHPIKFSISLFMTHIDNNNVAYDNKTVMNWFLFKPLDSDLMSICVHTNSNLGTNKWKRRAEQISKFTIIHYFWNKDDTSFLWSFYHHPHFDRSVRETHRIYKKTINKCIKQSKRKQIIITRNSKMTALTINSLLLVNAVKSGVVIRKSSRSLYQTIWWENPEQ